MRTRRLHSASRARGLHIYYMAPPGGSHPVAVFLRTLPARRLIARLRRMGVLGR